VTTSAQVIAGLLYFKGGTGGGRFVTLVAHFIDHGLMDIVIEDSWFVRAMGVMAGGTPGSCNRIIHVL